MHTYELIAQRPMFQEAVRLGKQPRELRDIVADLGCGDTVIRKARDYVKNGFKVPLRADMREDLRKVDSDKKIGVTEWREWCNHATVTQKLKRKSSWSQDTAQIGLPDAKDEIVLVPFSDTHIGSFGADHEAFAKFTDEVMNTDNVFLCLVGDMQQMAIKMRSVLEVSDNLMPPEIQDAVFLSWFEEIKDRVLFATWDNHAVMRMESQAGVSTYKNMVAKSCVYFNGIGHVNLTVGEQVYRIAASHVFRGRSIENPCHGAMRYMRREGIDRELAIAGDSHVPGLIKYVDGALQRVALNCGSMQINSGYGKRFFSLTTHANYPCVALHPKKHEMRPYWSLSEYLTIREAAKA